MVIPIGVIKSPTPKSPTERFMSYEEVVDPKKVKCEREGGVWDEETKTCKFTTKQKIEQNIAQKEKEASESKPLPPAPQGTVVQNAETGEPVGFINSKGDFVKAKKPEVEAYTQKQGAGAGAGAGTTEEYAQQQRLVQLSEQIGRIGTLTAAEEAGINWSQAIMAGAASSAGYAAGGVALGAVGGGVGSVPLGIAGGVGGFIKGIIGNIKEQQRGELQAADVELTNARTSMRQLAMLATQDPANADMYIQQYNQILTRVHQARRQTQVEVKGDLNSWMEDGREQLADFDAFLQSGGIADIYGQKLRVALISGVPLSINGEGLLE